MAHEEGHEGMPEDESTFIKAFFEIFEMVKAPYEERNSRLCWSPENRVYNKGDTHPVQTLVSNSFSIWYSGFNWGYGTSFPIYVCVCE